MKWLIRQSFAWSLFLLGCCLLLSWVNVHPLHAQGNVPPPPLAPGALPLNQVATLTMPPIDLQKLLQEDAQRARDGLPPRFAQSIPTQVTPSTHGTWEKLDAGMVLWRLRIQSPGALSLNLGFTHYAMPDGGQLYLYTPDYQKIVGPFTESDNEKHGQLWTPILPGDEIVVEVSLPADVVSQLTLTLTSVNHGYVAFDQLIKSPQSGSCNVDVVCPVADAWRDEIRSVARYTRSGSFLCSGALVNNTAQDLTPYFLTAGHCGITPANAPTIVAYWNYENSTCRPSNSPANSQPGDGSLDQFSTGAILRASYAPADMTLIELDDPIPSAYGVHWAGWDVNQTDALSATAIHHPNGEEKRISFEYEAPTTTSYYGFDSPGDGTHIRVTDWDLGTTEPGSSGSPLFNQDHRIIGQLHGGEASCNNDEPDWYGRLAASWLGGGEPTTRLLDWLDPLQTGVTTLNGLNAETDFTLTVMPTSLDVCSPNEATYDLTIDSVLGFSDTITLAVSGNPANTNPNFAPNPVVAPGASLLTISNTIDASPGSYTMVITGASPLKTHTSTVALNLFNSLPDSPTLSAPADGSSDVSITPTFEWQAAPQSTTYLLEVATDLSFSTIVYSATVSGASHQAMSPLSSNSTYYWRITPQNICGTGTPSTPFSFTTISLICSFPNLAIPDNDPDGVTDDLVITDNLAISDLNVFIEASHTYVGDLIFTLDHADSGTDMTLIDRPGFLNQGFGCDGDDIAVTLDDEAGSPVEEACADSVPTISGTFTPHSPLNAFDGENLNGTWRLSVSDRVSRDTGTLVQWCLLPQATPLTSPILAISKSGPPTATPGEPITYTLTVTNTGITATHILITDTIPVGTSYVGGGVKVGNVVSWTLEELAGFGSTYQVSFVVLATGTSQIPGKSLRSPTIVGGMEAEPGAWPWMASIQRVGFGHWCGGSLIHPQWILTAAHCTNGFTPANFSVILGRHDLTTNEGEEISVADIVQHPTFNPFTFDNDISLLRLNTTSAQTTVTVAGVTDTSLFAPGITATVTGWGDLSFNGPSPNTLHQVSVPIIANEVCNASIAYNGRVTENMFCAGLAEGGKDSCQGDSGGPLVVPNAQGDGWLQAGIVSWGEGCAFPNKYGVYTRVAQFENWLASIVPLGVTLRNDDYRVSADGGFSATGQVAVVTVVKGNSGLDEKYYLPILLKYSP
jgi:lysyl endopeptidase